MTEPLSYANGSFDITAEISSAGSGEVLSSLVDRSELYDLVRTYLLHGIYTLGIQESSSVLVPMFTLQLDSVVYTVSLNFKAKYSPRKSDNQRTAERIAEQALAGLHTKLIDLKWIPTQ